MIDILSAALVTQLQVMMHNDHYRPPRPRRHAPARTHAGVVLGIAVVLLAIGSGFTAQQHRARPAGIAALSTVFDDRN